MRLLHSIRIAIEIEASTAGNSLNTKAITDHAQLDISDSQNLLGFVVILEIKGYRHAGLLDQPCSRVLSQTIKGIARMRLSIISSIPPKPGIVSPEFFAPVALLNADSCRSVS